MKSKIITALLTLAMLAFLTLPTMLLAQTTTPAKVLPPPCWPAQVGGTGSKAVRVTSDYGQAIMWWCSQAEAVGFVASWAYTMVIPDKLPTSLVAALSAMWEANISSEAIDETQRIQLKQDAIIALQPLRPAEPRWIVAPLSTNTTRPVSLYIERTAADGTKQKIIEATPHRIAIKQADGTPTPCDPTVVKHSTSSSSTYVHVRGTPVTSTTPALGIAVAICRLQ